MNIRPLIRRVIPEALRRKLGARSIHCYPSFSQEGEDRILWVLLAAEGRRERGFYVDVGAHHPERYSNTKLFYDVGWRGISVDAMPGSMQLFRVARPNDINLEAAISSTGRTLTYYLFNEPALNGFSQEVADSRSADRSGWRIVGEQKIETTTLANLLTSHLPPDQQIDFLSVDVEGLDLDVLRSNDWDRFRPAVVAVEDFTPSRSEGPSDIGSYIESVGYHYCCRTILTSFFVDPLQMEFT